MVPNPDHELPPGGFARRVDPHADRTGRRLRPGVGRRRFRRRAEGVRHRAADKAREALVALGDGRGDDIEVRKGLTGGETVATSGTSRLSTGVEVEAKRAAHGDAARQQADDEAGEQEGVGRWG